ncbi:uncharacterized protein LOC132257052 isoform X2 [Phlebotomus argentipes]|uniref:uncharacterized protein LOC132257052 isoform X2 n=1 Tax=Phlebotomus argentipes TaxID=94469 RepID=UPI0028929A5D|nr:uncharacterized protein LOC132257052 isoform X2 [Phlebotomus argentipes]
MSVHYKYRYEKISSTTSMFLWKSFKPWTYKVIGLLVLIVMLSFTLAFTFNAFTKRFQGDQCPLRTKIRIAAVSMRTLDNSTVLRMQPQSMYFNQRTYCDYVAFPPVVMGLFSIIWATFFLICGYGSKSSGTLLPKPWRILTPSIIFSIVMTIASMIHSVYLTLEMRQLCEQLSIASIRYFADAQQSSCQDIMNLLDGDQYGLTTFTLYQIFTIASYITISLWIVTVIFLIFRCISGKDFQHVEVHMHPIQDSSPLQHAPDVKCDLCAIKTDD